MDMWALGLLVHAELPVALTDVLKSPAYREGVRNWEAQARHVPGLRTHLEYPANLQGKEDYADQVGLMLALSEADQMNEQQPVVINSSICSQA